MREMFPTYGLARRLPCLPCRSVNRMKGSTDRSAGLAQAQHGGVCSSAARTVCRLLMGVYETVQRLAVESEDERMWWMMMVGEVVLQRRK